MYETMKKSFTFGVVLTTILWSVGATALVPSAVYAVDMGDEVACDSIEAGNLVKTHGNPDIWAVNEGLTRSYFANGDLFQSWNNDNTYSNHYLYVTSECMNSFEAVGAVTPRPGSYLLKEGATDYLWAVLPGNKLTKISVEAATALYGSDYATKRLMVMDNATWVLYKDYRTTGEITETVPHVGMLVKNANKYYYVSDDMTLREVTSSGLTANRLATKWAYALSATTGYTMGDDVEVEETAISDRTQGLVVEATPADDLGSVTMGDVTVALSANTPESRDIPKNVTVEFLRLVLRAGSSEDAHVTGLKLSAAGLGAYGDINGVTVYADNTRYGNSRDIDSNKVATINFTNALVIPKGTSKEVIVKAQVAGYSKYALSIKEASDVMGVNVGGTFPIKGNDMSGVNVTVGQLTIDDEGTLSAVNLGDSGATLAKFKATNNNVEDVVLNQVIMRRSAASTASDSVAENLKLYVDGNMVASANSIDNKYITFTLSSPVTIVKNGLKRFTVTGDVVDGAGKAVTLTFDSSADVTATGNYYNFPAIIDITTDWYAQSVSINAGDVTIEKVNAPSLKVRRDTTDVEFGTFKVTVNSGATTELSTLNLTLASTNDPTGVQIENVEVFLKNTNTVYDLTSSSAVYGNSSMGLILTSGVTYEFVVRADVKSTATNGDYTFSIANAGTDFVLKETENDTTVSDITPNSVTLRKVEVETANMSFSQGSLSTAYTAVVGSAGNTLMTLNAKAGDAADLKITELKFKDLNATTTKYVASEFKLMKGTDVVKTVSANNLTSANEIAFSSLNEKVEAGKTVTYSLVVTLVNDTNQSGKVMHWYLSGYSAEDYLKGTAIYDTTADDNTASDGIIGSSDTGYTSLLSARSLTIVGTGSLNVSADLTKTATKYDTYQLAGAEGVAVADYTFKASYEPVKVTSLGVYTSSDMSANISRISLWRGTEEVAYATNISDTTTTLDQDFTVTGEQTYTLKVNLTKIGQNEPGAIDKSTTFQLTSLAAEGESGTALIANSASTVGSGEYGFENSTGLVTTASKNLGIVASKISTVSLKTSTGDVALATKLNSGIATNAAIIELQLPNTSNTNADGTSVKFTLATTTLTAEYSSKITNYTATIERIGGGGTPISSSVTGTAPAFDLTSGDATTDLDYQFNPGEIVYLLVKVTPTFTASIAGDSSIKLNLNTATGFSWTDRTGATAKTDLRLPGVGTISGTTISN